MTDTADPREAAVAALAEAMDDAIDDLGVWPLPNKVLGYFDRNPDAKLAMAGWLAGTYSENLIERVKADKTTVLRDAATRWLGGVAARDQTACWQAGNEMAVAALAALRTALENGEQGPNGR